MEARLLRIALVMAALLSMGASYRTQNFIVSAPTAQLAKEIGDKAETDRRTLAFEWLGSELSPWRQPCPITAHVSPRMGAGGATSFMFDRGRPFGWSMTIQGSRERVLDSVLPHEVTHTIFATHFGRPLPRWADEGACTTVEHESERRKQERMLISFLTTRRGIAFNQLFAMKEYPRDVLPLYAQGYSLARYLIAQGGKRKYVQYVGDGMKSNNWSAVTQQHYGYRDLSELQVTWLDWVRQGSPSIGVPKDVDQQELLVENTTPQRSNTLQPPTAQLAAAGRDQLAEPQDITPRDIPSQNIPPTSAEASQSIPLVPVASPPAEQLAQATEIRSWYIEQRNLAKARPSQPSGGRTELVSTAGSYAPGSTKLVETVPLTAVLTRPQPVGRPQQQVIQWSDSSATTPAASRSSGSGPIESPAVYHDGAISPSQTFLR